MAGAILAILPSTTNYAKYRQNNGFCSEIRTLASYKVDMESFTIMNNHFEIPTKFTKQFARGRK